MVNRIVGQLGTAIRAAASVALIASVLVLAGALAAGNRARIHDAVVLKTLGATRGHADRRLLAGIADRARHGDLRAGRRRRRGVVDRRPHHDAAFELHMPGALGDASRRACRSRRHRPGRHLAGARPQGGAGSCATLSILLDDCGDWPSPSLCPAAMTNCSRSRIRDDSTALVFAARAHHIRARHAGVRQRRLGDARHPTRAERNSMADINTSLARLARRPGRHCRSRPGPARLHAQGLQPDGAGLGDPGLAAFGTFMLATTGDASRRSQRCQRQDADPLRRRALRLAR